MVPLGKYSLHIAPETAITTVKTLPRKKCTNFVSRFDGHGSAPMPYHMYCLIEEIQSFPTLYVAIGRSLALVSSIGHANVVMCVVFLLLNC
jgi:hypothetical protein